ncbi:MAG TPA: hypothetical protein VFD35_13105 [Pricia sp.]|nr:hypothetical protein [Pricia sp.]
MTKAIGAFAIKLFGFSVILFLTHYYILSQFFTGRLYFSLWSIYCFHTVLVLAVYAILSYYKRKNKDMLKLFLGLTVLKMALSIVFLLPLFLKKSDHTQLEVLNFFIPYFLFLMVEIMGLNSFLQKS